MNELKTFVLTIAASGILIAVVDTIAPDGKNGRAVKFISSIFIILMVLSPLTKMLKSFDPSFADTGSAAFETEAATDFTQQTILEEVRQKIAEKAEQIVSSELSLEIKVRTVDLSMDEEGNILVNRIVYFSSSNSKEIEKLLRETFGEIEVAVDSGE